MVERSSLRVPKRIMSWPILVVLLYYPAYVWKTCDRFLGCNVFI